MADVPDAMKQLGRLPDPIFRPEERLFRRVRPDDIEGVTVAVDAIELPDMSVNREKYGPPDWLLLDEEYGTWGVAAFMVKDIPSDITHLGVVEYSFQAEHRPLRNNYPHSEIWAYKDGAHIDVKHAEDLDPEPQLRWRERLQWKIRIAIQPKIIKSR